MCYSVLIKSSVTFSGTQKRQFQFHKGFRERVRSQDWSRGMISGVWSVTWLRLGQPEERGPGPGGQLQLLSVSNHGRHALPAARLSQHGAGQDQLSRHLCRALHSLECKVYLTVTIIIVFAGTRYSLKCKVFIIYYNSSICHYLYLMELKLNHYQSNGIIRCSLLQ